jgi:hypothetical protein
MGRQGHSYLLASAGVSIYKIAKWLGDDVRTVQRHYAKLLPSQTEPPFSHYISLDLRFRLAGYSETQRFNAFVIDSDPKEFNNFLSGRDD